MDRSKEWLAPLTGVAFVLVGIAGFLIGGEPKAADEPVNEVVDFYLDNKDSVQSVRSSRRRKRPADLLRAYLRKVLHAAAGEGEMLVAGLVHRPGARRARIRDRWHDLVRPR